MGRKPTYEELEQKVKELENDTVRHKQLGDDLRESEARYRLLARNVTDVIWTMDMNQQFTYVSPSVKQLRGYSEEEAMAQKVEEVLTPDSLDIAFKAFEEELALEHMGQEAPLRPRVLELEQNCKDGSTVWTEAKMVFLRDPAGRPTGILGVTRDITTRKKTEEELRKYREQLEKLVEERTAELTRTIEQLKKEVIERKNAEHNVRLFRYAIEQSTEGVAVVDVTGHILFINDAFAHMHGYVSGDLVGKHLSIFHTSDQMPSVDAANRETLTTGSFSGEIWHVRRDGTRFPGAMRNWVLNDEEGNPVGIIGTLRDITERKQAQEALQRSERKYRTLYENLRDGSAAVNLDGKFIEFNSPFQEMLGYTEEEISQLTYKDHYCPVNFCR